MSFVNLSLITVGGLFVVLPIVLHMAMRQKPKHQMFPALRFVKQRQLTNQRRLRVRQALLLFLRCLLILLLALALARPSTLSSQAGQWLVCGALGLLLLIVLWVTTVAVLSRRGWPLLLLLGLLSLGLLGGLVRSSLALMHDQPPVLLGDRRAAIAAVLVVDTSPRMLYRYENRSRLERAQELAQWLLRQLPADSQVAIMDASSRPASYAVDLGAASAAVTALEPTYVPRDWSRMLEEALQLLSSSDKPRKELYLFSDLTQATWGDLERNATLERLRDSTDVVVQLIDLGIEDPSNDAITDLQLSQSTLTPGSPLQLTARVTRQGAAGERMLQLALEPAGAANPIVVNGAAQTPTAEVRGSELLPLKSEQASTARFTLNALPVGTHHGYLQLDGTDNLAFDDRRYFTVHVRPPHSVLLVTGDGAESYTITESLAPREFRQTGRAKFAFHVIPLEKLRDQRLTDFAAVALLDPTPLGDDVWRNLGRFVERGGGLACFLGRNVRAPQEFCSAAALGLLPATVERIWRDDSDGGLRLAPRDYSHPTLTVLRDLQTTIPWDALPVFRHWVVGELAPNAQVIVPYNHGKPAILERTLGTGRVLMMTTPISDPDLPTRPPWNLLTYIDPSWPLLILLDRMLLYLVQSQDATLAYNTGQTAQLPVPGQAGERYSLFTPRGTWQEVAAINGNVQIPFTDVPGTYRLRLDEAAEEPRGFAVNVTGDASRLERIDRERLTAILGADRLQIATTQAEIVREMDQARVGREFYPLLIPLLAVVLALEHVVANRFYPATSTVMSEAGS